MSDCIFCKIIEKKIPADIVFEDDKIIVFNDIEPQAPVHLLIVPKKHYESVLSVPAGDDIISHIHMVANRMALKFNIADSGFRLVNNCGEDGDQTVPHIHYHLLGGRYLTWPPG
jgi:histidine triad (HIT) family protein